MEFTRIDIIFMAILGFLAVRGLFKGLIRELFSFGSLIAGLLIAMGFYGRVALFITEQFGEQSWNKGLAFFIVFILVFIALKFIESIILKVMEETAAFSVDKVLGLILGLLEGIIICSLFTFLLDTQTIINTDEWIAGSFFVPFFVQIFPFLKDTGNLLMDNINV